MQCIGPTQCFHSLFWNFLISDLRISWQFPGNLIGQISWHFSQISWHFSRISWQNASDCSVRVIQSRIFIKFDADFSKNMANYNASAEGARRFLDLRVQNAVIWQDFLAYLYFLAISWQKLISCQISWQSVFRAKFPGKKEISFKVEALVPHTHNILREHFPGLKSFSEIC